MKIIKIIIIALYGIFTAQSCNSQEPKKVYVNSDEVKTNQQNQSNQSINLTRENAITTAVKIASPTIVGINVTEVRTVEYRDPFDIFFDDPWFQRYFGERRQRRTKQYEVQGLGSGFIISPDGYILTNHHVAGNATKIVVTTTDGKKYDAEIIGSDRTTDVALLKIDAKNLPYLILSNSDNIIIGEWVIALGNPFGLFDLNAKPTVTVGVVSNTGVNFTQDGRIYKGMIQTDAAISSGNSGGPLVNALGEVIGMNTIIFSTAQSGRGAGSIGIGWAIPINRVKKIVDKIIANKEINRNFNIGMEVRELDEQLARYLGLEINEGVVVTAVERNGAADIAKIEPGDVILEANGQKITKFDDYVIVVNDLMLGDKVEFLILRDGKELKRTVDLNIQRRRNDRR
ncbi:MAG: trypsin-like peptidase domain-containing protein [Candidatus Kapabacteria bacterium]|nr:trypsin-like peptidase domain-containing protein [Candidatus Kapabacteria bacterium]